VTPAIFEAACDCQKQVIDAKPEVMIPSVGEANELVLERPHANSLWSFSRRIQSPGQKLMFYFNFPFLASILPPGAILILAGVSTFSDRYR
jgi:hypothetical protein